jgi:subtilisin family serine protease
MGIPSFPLAHINKVNEPLNVDVAVMDTGIDSAHPDLNVVQSAGFADPGYNGMDWNGHGTHVAGILGAIDNLIGVVGVAPGVRLWSVQVLGPTQSDWSNLLAGVNYISQHADQISVVNASLNSTTNNNPIVALDQAVQSLVDQGIVFVNSAGNNGVDITGPDGVYGTPDDVMPAALPEVMAVSAMDATANQIASFSNFSKVAHVPSYVTSPGLGIDVTAPGVHIFSTFLTSTSGYTYLDGTSMAAPHVTGLVALYIAANGRGYSAQDVYNIRQIIMDNSQPQSDWPGYPNTGGPNNSPEPLAHASENWVPQPNILRAEPTADGFQISFPTVPGYTYTPQYTDCLTPPQWNELATNLVSGGASLNTNTITLPELNPTALWYRVVRKAAP